MRFWCSEKPFLLLRSGLNRIEAAPSSGEHGARLALSLQQGGTVADEVLVRTGRHIGNVSLARLQTRGQLPVLGSGGSGMLRPTTGPSPRQVSITATTT